MTPGTIAIIVLILAAIGYVLGKRRALQAANREGVKLHSLPGYYGESVALFTAVPALFLMAAWLFVQPIVIESSISAKIPDSVVPEGGAKSLVMVDVRRIAEGLGLSSRKAMFRERSRGHAGRPDQCSLAACGSRCGAWLRCGSCRFRGGQVLSRVRQHCFVGSQHCGDPRRPWLSPSGPGHALPPKCAPATSPRPSSRRF
jgi:hypothetical protein